MVDGSGGREDHPVVERQDFGSRRVGWRRRLTVAEAFQGVAETQVVGASDEVDDVAAGVAAEAVEAAGLRIDGEAWVLVLMEGAVADEVRAALPQRDAVRGDDIRDRVPLLDAVDVVDHSSSLNRVGGGSKRTMAGCGLTGVQGKAANTQTPHACQLRLLGEVR